MEFLVKSHNCKYPRGPSQEISLKIQTEINYKFPSILTL
uniref:Uncharacterized protein n=1 Tax=Rhizophora mucronata TaxID=61149 RepID=A0A2P2PEL8_RHIMU